MADELDGANEQNEASNDETPLENNLYNTMDGDKKPDEDGAKTDDVINTDDDKKKPEEGEGSDEKPADTKDGESDKTVEDDDLLGVEPKDDDKKADDDKKSDDDKSDDKGDDKSKAPEDYKLQLKEESLLGADAVKNAEEYAKKHGLSQEQAEEHLVAKEQAVEEYQKFLDDTADERSADMVKEKSKEWLTSSKESFGEDFKETVAKGNRFINAAATPEFKQLLKVSQLGNQKDFMAFCAKACDIAGLMDDNADLGGDTVQSEQSLEDQMYPTMK